jgi:hypothetical protein
MASLTAERAAASAVFWARLPGRDDDALRFIFRALSREDHDEVAIA